MDTTNFTGLSNFKSKLDKWARRQLEISNPKFVKTFLSQLEKQGLEKAHDATKSLLGDPPEWYAVLTAMADVEMALDKMWRARQFLGASPMPGSGELSNLGAWVDYHSDYWAFATDALLERVEILINLSIDRILRYKNPEWRTLKNELLRKIKKIKDEIGNVRHPLAHGGGGGITGLEEDRLWETYLLVGSGTDLAAAKYKSISRLDYQQKWYERIGWATAIVTAVLDDVLGRLSGEKALESP